MMSETVHKGDHSMQLLQTWQVHEFISGQQEHPQFLLGSGGKWRQDSEDVVTEVYVSQLHQVLQNAHQPCLLQ